MTNPTSPTERVGRYQLLEPIGIGPSGAVSRAKVFGVAGFERQFAVKRFHAELTATAAMAAMMSAAARAYGSLEHPRIARMSEFGVAQGATFTAVEYVLGLDALRLVSEARLAGVTLAAGGALALVSQAARAVGYAHGRGLTHLGLAPTNVIVTADGDIKITDFGILSATLPPRPTDVARLAQRIPYLAPEQLANEATSAATDVFALGVLAYELVTGSRTFRGDTPQQVASAIMAGPPAEPALPRPIVRVLQRCLARSPFERFPDARAMADALDAALRVAPVPGTRKDIGAQVKDTLDRLAALNEGQMSGMVALHLGTGPIRRLDDDDLRRAAAADPRAERARTEAPGEAPAYELGRSESGSASGPLPRVASVPPMQATLPQPPAPAPGTTMPDLPKHPMTTMPGLAPPPIPVPPGVTGPPTSPLTAPPGTSTLLGIGKSPPAIPGIKARPGTANGPGVKPPAVPQIPARPATRPGDPIAIEPRRGGEIHTLDPSDLVAIDAAVELDAIDDHDPIADRDDATDHDDAGGDTVAAPVTSSSPTRDLSRSAAEATGKPGSGPTASAGSGPARAPGTPGSGPTATTGSGPARAPGSASTATTGSGPARTPGSGPTTTARPPGSGPATANLVGGPHHRDTRPIAPATLAPLLNDSSGRRSQPLDTESDTSNFDDHESTTAQSAAAAGLDDADPQLGQTILGVAAPRSATPALGTSRGRAETAGTEPPTEPTAGQSLDEISAMAIEGFRTAAPSGAPGDAQTAAPHDPGRAEPVRSPTPPPPMPAGWMSTPPPMGPPIVVPSRKQPRSARGLLFGVVAAAILGVGAWQVYARVIAPGRGHAIAIAPGDARPATPPDAKPLAIAAAAADATAASATADATAATDASKLDASKLDAASADAILADAGKPADAGVPLDARPADAAIDARAPADAARPDAAPDAGKPDAGAPADARSAPDDAARVAIKPLPASPTASPADVLAIASAPPGARVFLDGADAGATPVKLAGSPDRHTIALLLAGHELYVAQVDGHGSFQVPLKEVTPANGPAGIKVLRCKDKDRYYVFVDGKPTGQTCPTERIGCEVGPHTVEVYDVVSETRRKWDIVVKDTRLSFRVRVE